MEWYLKVLNKYAEFDGRAHRTEYWMFVLFNVLISIGLGLVGGLIGHGLQFLSSLYALAVLVPGIAVAIRRLHDIGKSGWWLLVAFVPLIGAIILLVYFVQDSQPENNQYGPNPKAV